MVGNNKLSPCPVCKSDMQPQQRCYKWYTADGILLVKVKCPQCGHESKSAWVAHEARRRWNAQLEVVQSE